MEGIGEWLGGIRGETEGCVVGSGSLLRCNWCERCVGFGWGVRRMMKNSSKYVLSVFESEAKPGELQ